MSANIRQGRAQSAVAAAVVAGRLSRPGQRLDGHLQGLEFYAQQRPQNVAGMYRAQHETLGVINPSRRGPTLDIVGGDDPRRRPGWQGVRELTRQHCCRQRPAV